MEQFFTIDTSSNTFAWHQRLSIQTFWHFNLFFSLLFCLFDMDSWLFFSQSLSFNDKCLKSDWDVREFVHNCVPSVQNTEWHWIYSKRFIPSFIPGIEQQWLIFSANASPRVLKPCSSSSCFHLSFLLIQWFSFKSSTQVQPENQHGPHCRYAIKPHVCECA